MVIPGPLSQAAKALIIVLSLCVRVRVRDRASATVRNEHALERSRFHTGVVCRSLTRGGRAAQLLFLSFELTRVCTVGPLRQASQTLFALIKHDFKDDIL